MTISVEALTGTALTAVLPDLARLRIAVFRDWPYLYDGSLDYERAYLAKFAAASDTIIVIARDGNEVVGASTASPMTGHADEFAATFRAQGYDPLDIYYFGESVLLPAYRGQGIGHSFFGHREARARYLGRFTHAAFCSVVRPPDHPLRPKDARPLTPFWLGRGYHPVEGLMSTLTWKDIDEPAATPKPMQFWMQAL
jgi:GNAT superfamily N-acetyltransferase